MPRRKSERVELPDGDVVSRKASKNSEFTYWGTEPKWQGTDFATLAREKWEELDPKQRISRYFKAELVPLIKADWVQLKKDERQLLVNFEVELAISEALNWYNAMSDDGKAKDAFLRYAAKNFPKRVPALKKIDETVFHTYGAICRMTELGCPAPQKFLDRIFAKAEQWTQNVVVDDKDESVNVTKIVRKERDPKISEYIGLVNGLLDDYGFTASAAKKPFPDASMGDAILKAGGSNSQRIKVHEYFAPDIIELKQAIEGGDSYVQESYSTCTKATLKKIYNWLTGQPSQELIQKTRTRRKTRKKKEKTAAQILKRFAFKASDEETGIKSIDPEDIIGAQQLWVFNTKTRRLGVYHAKNDNGLNVKRKSIENYDEDKSVNKKIRKPKEILPKVLSAGKVALRHLLDEIRAVETPMKSRINEETILVKVVK